MKHTRLMEIIREVIQEEMDAIQEDSEVAKAAKAQGLTSFGFGRWGKDGKVTHINNKGKLVPFTKAAMQKKTGMTFGRGKYADTMYSPQGFPSAKMSEPGKIQRLKPKRTPETDRARNRPTDALAPTGFGLSTIPGTPSSGQKIVDKVTEKFYDNMYSFQPNQTVPMDEFTQKTGITRKAAQYFTSVLDDYEIPFSYDEVDDTIMVHDGQDV